MNTDNDTYTEDETSVDVVTANDLKSKLEDALAGDLDGDSPVLISHNDTIDEVGSIEFDEDTGQLILVTNV